MGSFGMVTLAEPKKEAAAPAQESENIGNGPGASGGDTVSVGSNVAGISPLQINGRSVTFAKGATVRVLEDGTIEVAPEAELRGDVSNSAQDKLNKLASADRKTKAAILTEALTATNLYDYAPWLLTKEATEIIKSARAELDENQFGLPEARRFPLYTPEIMDSSLKLAATFGTDEQLGLVKAAAIREFQKKQAMEDMKYEKCDQTTQKKKTIKDDDED